MIIAILKIVVFSGMLAFIAFCLMAIGLIPGERFCEFMRKHEKIQVAFGIMMAIGLLGSFIIVL